MATKDTNRGIVDELPVDRLMAEALDFGKAFAKHGLDRVATGLDSATHKLGDVASGHGVSDVTKGARAVKEHNPVQSGAQMVKEHNPVKGGAELVAGGTKAAASKVKDSVGGVKDSVGGAVEAVTPSGPKGKGAKGKKGGTEDLKVTNIVESVDVPVPREVAYQEWTRFEEFPTFMKKVENVSQEDDDVVTWKAQVFWSHRTWKAKIIDQVPPERIVWKSQGKKGRVDGAVTFHELAPDLTRVLVTLEYHPQGLFEHTGNLWRAQGRRVRVELRHFRRHIANSTLLHQDEVEGWTGEIHEGDVKKPGRRSTAKTAAARKSPAKRSTAKRSPAKKSTASRSTAKKTAASRPTAKKSTAKKSTSTRPPAKRSTAKKSTAKKSTAKRAPAKKSPAKKSAAKKTTTKKSTTSARKRQPARSRS
jgi:uncharacterized membrane protein